MATLEEVIDGGGSGLVGHEERKHLGKARPGEALGEIRRGRAAGRWGGRERWRLPAAVVLADEEAQVSAIIVGVLRDVRVARTALEAAGRDPVVVRDAV